MPRTPRHAPPTGAPLHLQRFREFGLTANATADLLRVSPRQIYRWENGDDTPGHDYAERITALAGILHRLRTAWDDDTVMLWLLAPHPDLRSVRQAIATSGGTPVYHVSTSPYRHLQAGRYDSITKLAEKDASRDGVSA